MAIWPYIQVLVVVREAIWPCIQRPRPPDSPGPPSWTPHP